MALSILFASRHSPPPPQFGELGAVRRLPRVVGPVLLSLCASKAVKEPFAPRTEIVGLMAHFRVVMLALRFLVSGNWPWHSYVVESREPDCQGISVTKLNGCSETMWISRRALQWTDQRMNLDPSLEYDLRRNMHSYECLVVDISCNENSDQEGRLGLPFLGLRAPKKSSRILKSFSERDSDTSRGTAIHAEPDGITYPIGHTLLKGEQSEPTRIANSAKPVNTILDARILHGRFAVSRKGVLYDPDKRCVGPTQLPTFSTIHPSGTISFLPTWNQMGRCSEGAFIGGNANWWHFLLEVVPRAFDLTRAMDTSGLAVFVNTFGDFKQTEVLAGLLPEADVIDLREGSDVHVDRLFVVEPTYCVDGGEYWFQQDFQLFRQYRDWLIQELPCALPSQPRARQLAVRRKEGLFRRLTNSRDLFRKLEDRGFTIIEPASQTLPETISSFAAAETVVIEYGAATANLLFCREGINAVVLKNPGYRETSDDVALVQALGCHYLPLYGKIPMHVRLRLDNDAYHVQPNHLVQLLDRLRVRSERARVDY